MQSILAKLPKPFFALAPLDDVTDTVFRQIVADCAAPDLMFTEFVNVDGLQSPGRGKLLHKLRFTAKEKPLIAQVWGKVPENFHKTAHELVKLGFDGVDINFGCPDKSVIKNGCCVAMINNRTLAGEIIQSVQEGVANKLPVSVKTRLGLNEIDLTWPEFLLKQKLNMLTIHGRTAKEMSKVPAHWDEIGKIREQRDKIAPQTLLVGNGDVLSRSRGESLAKKYELDGIMIGRGIFHDPYIFSDASPWQDFPRTQRIELYKRHVELFAKTWTNNERKLHTLNKFCKIYIQNFDGAKELREKLMNAQSAQELTSLLNQSSN